jgi:hypothetical protein
MPDPDPAPESDEALSEQVKEDLAALVELTAAGVELDGEVQVTETTWVIYGHTSYDSEVIAGEYHDVTEVTEVMRAIPHPPPADDET